jgi:hypothetical protein
VRGALIDLTWRAPEFDPATRQLVGFELFRDDMSTRPPVRRRWQTVPGHVVEARGLEILPNSEYGVQPVWRLYAPQPPYPIAFGPPRLSRDLAGPSIVVPPEERIHSLASLQRQGLITSEEMELAVDDLLGRKAQAPPEPEPLPDDEMDAAAAARATPAKMRRVVLAYVATAVVLVLAVLVAGPLAGRLLFTNPSAVNISGGPSPTQSSPSPSNSPTPTALPVDLRPVLIKKTDVRTGYVAGPYDSKLLCDACVPASSSLSVVLQNAALHRTIVSAATYAPTSAEASSVTKALMAARSSGSWATGKGLGNESHTATENRGGKTYFYVVWRTGSMTNAITLVSNNGSGLTMQNAIDLAKIQQARAAKVHP